MTRCTSDHTDLFLDVTAYATRLRGLLDAVFTPRCRERWGSPVPVPHPLPGEETP